MEKKTGLLIMTLFGGILIGVLCMFGGIKLELNRWIFLLFIAISLGVGVAEWRNKRMAFSLAGFFIAAFISTQYILIH
ncbi:hypothetical protein MFLO_06089 [Listeria floridensis FSL S10-1187]|uniref:DUF3953 domain-containing protein n=1 Tax=Listeria floridensis FSL S10-1187 TaxID=1265817 RepID=A0ABN0RG94_9LIST|nr:hypothetical protein [Listeria floridensis]EUJ32837.1 hypothetical protein MFLO_06089 [Listeria floridensis FSL S10-1187]